MTPQGDDPHGPSSSLVIHSRPRRHAGLAAAAQRRPTVAIMPTQYFKADAESAANITRALAQQFQSERYTVIPLDRSERLFHEHGSSALHGHQRYSAPTVRPPPRRRSRRPSPVDGVGLPLNPQATASDAPTPKAVLYLRVLNVRTGQPLYTRQVAHYFTAEPTSTGEYTLLPPWPPPPLPRSAAPTSNASPAAARRSAAPPDRGSTRHTVIAPPAR